MLIILLGQDTWRLQKRIHALLNRYREIASSQTQVRQWEGAAADLGELAAALGTGSLFGEKRFVLLRDVLAHPGLEEFLRARQRGVVRDEDAIVVVVHEGEAPKKSGIVSYLQKNAKSVEDFPLLSGGRLASQLKAMARELGVSLSAMAARKLQERVGPDLWRAEQELRKLSAFAAGRQVEEKDVALLVAGNLETRIFDTLDAAASRDAARALSLLREHEARGESPLSLLAMFSYQVRTMIQVKEQNKSGVHPYVLRKMSVFVRRFSLDQLRGASLRLLDIELRLKTGRAQGFLPLESFLVWLALERASAPGGIVSGKRSPS